MSPASSSCSSSPPTPLNPTNTLPQITICTFTPAHKPALGRQSSNVRAAAAAACRCRVCLRFAGYLHKSQMRCSVTACVVPSITHRSEKSLLLLSASLQNYQTDQLFVMSQRAVITPSSRHLLWFVRISLFFCLLPHVEATTNLQLCCFLSTTVVFFFSLLMMWRLLHRRARWEIIIIKRCQIKIAECCQ